MALFRTTSHLSRRTHLNEDKISGLVNNLVKLEINGQSNNCFGIPPKREVASLADGLIINSGTSSNSNFSSVSATCTGAIRNNASVTCKSTTSAFELICDTMTPLIEKKRQQIKMLIKNYSNVSFGPVTVFSVLNGMRDIVGMATETSELDPHNGIKFRGYTIDDILNKCPGGSANSRAPFIEGVFWLLLTNELPTRAQCELISRELNKRCVLPKHVYKVLDSLPVDAHPMTQFIVAVSAAQTESTFRKSYNKLGYSRDNSWKFYLNDALDMLARNLLIVGYIFKRTCVDANIREGDGMEIDFNLDYSANLAKLLGQDSECFNDLMRLYLVLHADHEGGNVSAHASHLVGSALTDAYFSFAGGLSGLSGPLHGMANQECLSWIKNLVASLGYNPTVEMVEAYAKDCLAKGQVIPGYGHAVLRVVDPRHLAFMNFAHDRFPNDPLLKVLDTCLEAIPKVLKATGKVKSPNANVDCSTGVVLHHFGIDRPDLFTMFFGVSRAFGIMAQLVWARACKFPIERPKSYTLDHIANLCSQQK